jgi:hypothetical protein
MACAIMASRANFDALYGPSGELAIRPATELMLMMHPFFAVRIPGSTALIHRTAPK